MSINKILKPQYLLAVVMFPVLVSGQDISQKLDTYLSKRTEMGHFSGAALVAIDGKILLRKGYGFADVEKRISYTHQTTHNVASITKMFTALTAIKLRDEGKLQLENSICVYVKDCPETWKLITVLHLIRHTSGIPDDEMEMGSEKYFQFMKQNDPANQLINNAKKNPLKFQPGEKFSYSNTGYIILSRIIEDAVQKPFPDVVREKILKPAKLKSTVFAEESLKLKNLAVGYTYGDIGWEKILGGTNLFDGHLVKLPALPVNRPIGPGGLYSTVDDLYRWSQLMDGSGVVPIQTATEVFTPGVSNYGYGWFIDKAFDRKRFRHNGINPGYLTEFVKFPDDKVTIILFSNVDRARMSVLIRDLSAIVFELPYDLPVQGKPIKLVPEQIERLVGDYKMADGKILRITQGERYLTAAVENLYTAGLIPLSPTEFYFPLGDGKAIFGVNEKGKVIRVNMRFQGEDHPAERINRQSGEQ